MISNELLDEIIYISKKGILLDQNILKKVFYELHDNLGNFSKQFLNEIKFEKIDEDEKTRAIFVPDEKLIIIDLIAMYKEEKELSLKQKTSFLTQNLNIIIDLIHEFEHAKEFSKILKGDFEGKLLKYSRIYDNQNLYMGIYSIIPSEKIAHVNSYEILTQILLNYPNFVVSYFEEYKYLYNNYLQMPKMGYYYDEFKQEYNIPLLDYLAETGQKDVLRELFTVRKVDDNKETKISKLDVITRMKYGLPIKKEHIKELNKQKILTRGTK